MGMAYSGADYKVRLFRNSGDVSSPSFTQQLINAGADYAASALATDVKVHHIDVLSRARTRKSSWVSMHGRCIQTRSKGSVSERRVDGGARMGSFECATVQGENSVR